MGGSAAVLQADLDAYCSQLLQGQAAASEAQALSLYAALSSRFRGGSMQASDVEEAFAAWAVAGRGRALQAAASSSSSSRQSSSASAPPLPLQALLRSLLQRGLLQRSLACGAGALVFGVPEAAVLVSELAQGRAALLRFMARQPAREALRSTVIGKAPGKGGLSTDFLIRDAVGRGLLKELPSASGIRIRAL
jgi:hypothetical protein